MKKPSLIVSTLFNIQWFLTLAPDPSPSEYEIAIAKLKKHKSPGCDRIPAELIQAGGETLWYEIHKLIN
jgi:hypothetical protein